MHESAARDLLLCPACRAGTFATVVFERAGGHVVHGVLSCGSCGAWYRIEDRIPELLPMDLRDEARAAAFQDRFRARWHGWDAPAPADAATHGGLKREQMRFFREHAERYDIRITDSPFWNAFDDRFIARLAGAGPRGGIVLELGAGTGRYAPALARQFDAVWLLDLSEAMVRQAARRHAADGGSPRIQYLIADAEHLPIRDGVAACVMCAGVLSYLGEPGAAVAAAARTLAPDGVLIAHENNRSAFRPLFDALQRVWRPWIRKSWPPRGALSAASLGSWTGAAGLAARVWTEVFLPPQLLNLMAPARAARWLGATDAMFGGVPWLGRQGGLALVVARAATPDGGSGTVGTP